MPDSLLSAMCVCCVCAVVVVAVCVCVCVCVCARVSVSVRPCSLSFHHIAVVDAMDYFRAVVKSGEVSQRTLDLTEDVLNLNPANYTVWCGGDAPHARLSNPSPPHLPTHTHAHTQAS